ncbi:centrosomal protein kizuna [Protobothrops mucrosquamatus]|uniref:centrosomal protein kizuna n=1 Tax=Protobothrops mucrosquamatus TaxID=103944 RepID=UPI000775C00D|nr:centrosomal protein kizuna [Protobothrops mucrosquamatus]
MAGNVCGARNPPVAGCDKGDYDEQIRRIQAHLRHSESKRVELERKMLEYSTPDTSITKLKYANLKKYLNEICERQKNSLLRNQDLLKEFDCIEAHIRKFASRSESLPKLKAEYEKEIKNRLLVERKDTLKHEMRDGPKHQMIPEARQSGINTRTAMSRGLYHSATIFMGRQMSAVSSVEDFGALQKSELTKSFSISDPYSYRQPSQSCYMTDSCVVQTNSDLQCSNKSDKIDGKTSLLKAEEMPITSSVSYENERTCLTGESIANNDSNNFVENKAHPEPKSLLHRKLSFENRSTSLKSYSPCKSLTREHSLQYEQGTKEPISLIGDPDLLVSANECSEEKFPVLGSTIQLDKNILQEEDKSLSSSTDLTVSLSEEEEESTSLKLQQNLNSADCKLDNTICNNEEYSQMFFSTEHSCSGLELRECLSFEGFCHVLAFIEELVAKVPSECPALYQRETANTAELEKLIRLCNKGVSLAQENFDACEALVLYQLQKLLQTTMNGCLLQDRMFNDKRERLNEEQSRSELASYFTKIWERLSKHILFLQKHHILLRQEVKDIFGTLLILENHKEESPTSPVFKDFVDDCEDRSFSCSDKTSYNSRAKNSPEKQGLNISGLKEQKSNGTSSEPSFSSLERKSSLPRDENQRGIISTIKSKAFWGDSDDSNSDIEAALRPQEHCSQDGFSDFYD